MYERVWEEGEKSKFNRRVQKALADLTSFKDITSVRLSREKEPKGNFEWKKATAETVVKLIKAK